RAGAGHVEHVSGSLTLRVDDCDFDIAAQFSHGGADVVQQSGPVLGNNLEQGTVLRTAVVGLHAGLDLHFRVLHSRLELGLHEIDHVNFSRNRLGKLSFEAADFGG